MSQSDVTSVRIAETAELHETLERMLGQHFGASRRVVDFYHRPSHYHSSFAIEELSCTLDDGTRLQLILKDLSQRALLDGARRAKPQFLYHPEREIEVYRKILAPNGLGPTCYGTVVEPRIGRYWLLLEKVPGLELYQIGDVAVWQQVARWLALMHTRFADRVEDYARAMPLIVYDEDYYVQWMRRAQAFLNTHEQPAELKEKVRRLAGCYPQIVRRLARLPATFIHGEFYASNIIVQGAPGEPRVCPVDWEMAAAGPGLVDLAALTAGNWTEEERTAMALEYLSALPPSHNRFPTEGEFLKALDYCRVQTAVQWLGWFGRRRAYSEHAYDWLSEAATLAEKLGL